jgi:hypothetical protein
VREGHLRWLARSAARARRRAGGKEGAGELRYAAINSAPALAGQLVACSRQRRRERDGRAEEEKDARRAACLRPLLRWGRAVGREDEMDDQGHKWLAAAALTLLAIGWVSFAKSRLV